jgi:hypothetical protein
MTPRTLRASRLAVATLVPVALAALLAGCKSSDVPLAKIETLISDPARFDRHRLRVAGEVTRSLGILGYGAYELDDGTGKLPVIAKETGAPPTGAKVGVEGEFRAAFTLGSTTAAALVEKQRLIMK